MSSWGWIMGIRQAVCWGRISFSLCLLRPVLAGEKSQAGVWASVAWPGQPVRGGAQPVTRDCGAAVTPLDKLRRGCRKRDARR